MRYLLATLALLFAAPALADTAAAAPVEQSPLYTLFLQYIAAPLFSGIGILVMTLLAFATAWVKARAEKDKAAGKVISANDVAARTLHFGTILVQDLQNTLRPELEAALEDGILTQEEKDKLKSTAMKRLKDTLGEEGMRQLREVLGIAEEGLGHYLAGIIETALGQVKATEQIAKLPPGVSVSIPPTLSYNGPRP